MFEVLLWLQSGEILSYPEAFICLLPVHDGHFSFGLA